MDADLKSLRIDREKKSVRGPSRRAVKWIVAGVVILILLGLGRFAWSRIDAAPEVEVVRVQPASFGSGAGSENVILNATGYIIAAHKIQVASKVLGKVAWIGVDKGDRVQEGQVLVRLEDDEYRSQLAQAKGQMASLEARLAEMLAGSRPEEIARAKAEVETGKADLVNAQVTLDRNKRLVEQGVLSNQSYDDAKARCDAQAARVVSLERSYDLIKIGPRKEQIDSMRGQLDQARGAVSFCETQLTNTVIRAPVTGTILERAVEKGEFVTTSFVGERGAKGYVVSLADLRDLRVELDINQNDFAKLTPRHRGVITIDAFPDRRYQGAIEEISPEANRQKATVQVKVKVLQPDEYLRPEMNAAVAFLGGEKPAAGAASRRVVVFVPASAVRKDAVFVFFNGKALRRPVKASGTTNQGIRIDDGLTGGEDIIVNPPAELKDGDRVRRRQG
jgi:HlyD family secretion protein